MSAVKPRSFSVDSFDGTSIAARESGSGDDAPLLLVNAIGPDFSAWRRVAEASESRRRVLSWDFRGFHGSGAPASERNDAAAHCEDAMAVLDEAGVDEFVVAAWSTGTRIALEIARAYPERAKALVLVCGGFGRGLLGLFRHLEISSAFPFGAGLAKHFAGSLEGPFRAFVARPEFAGVVRQSGVIGPTADIDTLVEVVQSFARCDLRRLLATYEEVVGAADVAVLTEVQAPCLAIAGARDRFTTAGMVDAMVRKMPAAEKVVYENASHFLPIEYPDRLAGDMDGFFRLSER